MRENGKKNIEIKIKKEKERERVYKISNQID